LVCGDANLARTQGWGVNAARQSAVRNVFAVFVRESGFQSATDQLIAGVIGKLAFPADFDWAADNC